MKQALLVDSISSVTGAFVGTSSAPLILNRSPAFPRWAVAPVDGGGGRYFVPAGYLPAAAGGHGAALRGGGRYHVGVLMTSSPARVNWQDLNRIGPGVYYGGNDAV